MALVVAYSNNPLNTAIMHLLLYLLLSLLLYLVLYLQTTHPTAGKIWYFDPTRSTCHDTFYESWTGFYSANLCGSSAIVAILAFGAFAILMCTQRHILQKTTEDDPDVTIGEMESA